MLRFSLFMNYGDVMFSMTMHVINRYMYWIKKGQGLVVLLMTIDLVLYPIQLALNTIALFIWYLPFSPMTGMMRLAAINAIIEIESAEIMKLTNEE